MPGRHARQGGAARLLSVAAGLAVAGAAGCGSPLQRYAAEAERERREALLAPIAEPDVVADVAADEATRARRAEPVVVEPAGENVDVAEPPGGRSLSEEVAAFAARLEAAETPAAEDDPAETSGVAWAEPGDVPALEDEPELAEVEPARAIFPEIGTVTEQPVPPDPLPPIGDANNTAPPAAAPMPAVAATPPSLPEIDRVLAERIESDPRDVEAHLEQQVLLWLRGENAPDVEAFAGLPAEDRELVAAVVDGLVNLRTTLARPGQISRRELVAPIVEMGDRLSRGGGLTLASMQLASDIEGFGLYTPMDAALPSKLPPGRRAHALLYVEVENFQSRPDGDGQWETRLLEKLVLYRESGLQVWATEPKEVVDVARNRRDDFFLSRPLVLPEDLPPGSYTLKMTLTDDLANAVSEATLPVQILPPGR